MFCNLTDVNEKGFVKNNGCFHKAEGFLSPLASGTKQISKEVYTNLNKQRHFCFFNFLQTKS